MLLQIVILILTFSLYYDFKNKTNIRIKIDLYRKKLIQFVCILLIIQSGLRHLSIGADTYGYALMYNQVDNDSWENIWNAFVKYYMAGATDKGTKDLGYTLLQKFFCSIGFNFRFFFIFVAVFFFVAYGRLLYKYTRTMEEIIISILLYEALFYSFYSITGIRQVIATAGVLYIVPYAIDIQSIKFFVGLLIFATIHTSCLLFIPFYFYIVKKFF